MGAVRPLFDSNVLIHALNGTPTPHASALLLDWQELPVSIVTWIEVMAGSTPDTEQQTRRFLARFVICDLTPQVAEIAVRVRHTLKLKLPVIYATALATGRTLVTYNRRDFPEGTESVMIP